MANVRLLDRLAHAAGVGQIVGQWFLTEDMLSVPRRFQGDLHVQITRYGDADQVHISTRYHLMPVRFEFSPPELLREGLQVGGSVLGTNHFHDHPGREIIPNGSVAVSIRMRHPHERMPNQTYPNLVLLRGNFLSLKHRTAF